MRRVLCALVLCACFALVGQQGAVALPAEVSRQPVDVPETHDPPVDAPIIDPFRPPAGPFAPGNRGLEYDTEPGQIVRASSKGTVTFAGQVGGNLFVTIQHDSTLRTTVGFVDSLLVSAGESIEKGQVIAVAGHTIHFTARRNGVYFDPETLFVAYRVVVRLVAH